MINFCWPIGLSITIDTFLHAPPYLLSDVQAASMRFAGVIGGLCGKYLHLYSLPLFSLSIIITLFFPFPIKLATKVPPFLSKGKKEKTIMFLTRQDTFSPTSSTSGSAINSVNTGIPNIVFTACGSLSEVWPAD